MIWFPAGSNTSTDLMVVPSHILNGDSELDKGIMVRSKYKGRPGECRLGASSLDA